MPVSVCVSGLRRAAQCCTGVPGANQNTPTHVGGVSHRSTDKPTFLRNAGREKQRLRTGACGEVDSPCLTASDVPLSFSLDHSSGSHDTGLPSLLPVACFTIKGPSSNQATRSLAVWYFLP